MPRKFKFCLRCRRTIAENDVQRGLFVQTPHGMLCPTCAQQLDEETEAAKKPAALSEVERSVQEPVPAEPPARAPAPAAPDSSSPAEAAELRRAGPPTAPAGMQFDEPQSGSSEPPAQLLDGIRQHLEAIHRTLVFEKSSPWNVFATVAQCLAVGMLILAAVNWADNPTQLLLVALVFQVMALTFFVRGK